MVKNGELDAIFVPPLVLFLVWISFRPRKTGHRKPRTYTLTRGTKAYGIRGKECVIWIVVAIDSA